jgi:2-methylisocitrate lyase-like PEP mutase family enzyme
MAPSSVVLHELIQRDEILLAPGVCDAMEARMAVQKGAEAVYISGNAVASSVHGNPDIGLTSFKEALDRARIVTNAVDVPVICDVDDGYGNPLNVVRTVREFEAANVDAVQIEDQQWPKKCGHLEGKKLVSVEEMCAKVDAAVDARRNEDFLVVARTDAVATDGVDAAIRRAEAYVEHGADVIFVDAPESRAQLERIGESLSDVPLLTNIPYGGKTPVLPASELEALGFDVMIYACVAQKAKIAAIESVFETILETGDERDVLDRLGTWQDRERVTEFERWRELEDRYVD